MVTLEEVSSEGEGGGGGEGQAVHVDRGELGRLHGLVHD